MTHQQQQNETGGRHQNRAGHQPQGLQKHHQRQTGDGATASRQDKVMASDKTSGGRGGRTTTSQR